MAYLSNLTHLNPKNASLFWIILLVSFRNNLLGMFCCWFWIILLHLNCGSWNTSLCRSYRLIKCLITADVVR